MYEGKHFNEKIRQIGFLLLILLTGCLVVNGLHYFISSVLGGFTIYMLLRKPQQYLLKKGWGKTLTTTVLMVATFLFLVVVLGGIVSILLGKFKNFDVQVIVKELHSIHDLIIDKWGYNIFSEDVIRKVMSTLGSILPGLISNAGNVIANVVMLMFLLFFMLNESAAFERGLERSLPLTNNSIRILKKAAHSMILGNAVGIPLIMFGQAVVSGLAYWIFGAGDPVIWALLTAFAGLIPVVGTAGVWLPLSINLIAGGQIWQGIALIAYGLCVVSSVDNVVRIVFLKKTAHVHPLITLFGVLLGMNLFGFWGIIFGPLLLSGFFLLLDIYKKEFN
jgi:predicted PurR-regulated permease PerM